MPIPIPMGLNPTVIQWEINKGNNPSETSGNANIPRISLTLSKSKNGDVTRISMVGLTVWLELYTVHRALQTKACR